MLHTTHSSRRQGANKLIGLLALMAVILAATAAGSEPARTEPVPAEVSLYLNVEKKGGLVTGLGEKNFRLYEDGNYRPFRLEKPEEPASIAVLMEYSLSSGYFLDDMNAAMQGLLRHAPEGHWYALATFSRGLEIQADFTQQVGRLNEAWSQLGAPAWSDVNTYDALWDMLDKLERLPGRRILIVVGSGADTFSEHTLDDVRKKLDASNVTVFVAGTGSVFRTSYEAYMDTSSRLSFLQAQSFLRTLGEKSGGYAWFPNHFNGFPDVMQGITQSLATQYRLVYQTTARGSGKLRKIKVEAFRLQDDKREDFQVLVREGWR